MNTTKATVSELAEALHISRQSAYKAIERCGIPLVGGLVDLQAAVAVYRAKTRARVRKRPAADPQAEAQRVVVDPQGYEVSRAQREAAEAKIAELQLGQLNGTLFERAACERAVFAAARMLRDQLSSCAGVLGATVAGLTSAQECEAEVRREHLVLLGAFVRELNQKFEAL